jgi:aminoglycoside phosphotransferase (APT) family kinase protein
MPEGIDLDRFEPWAKAALPDLVGPFRCELIVGGRSNITARIHDARGESVVLRRPPLHGVLATAHDVLREYRIIAALTPTAVPVPAAMGYCDDPDVLGAPFYVMADVPGVVLHDGAAVSAETDASSRREIGDSLVETLLALHAVDIDAIGLGQLAKREGMIARQLKRWKRQLEATDVRDHRLMLHIHDQLEAKIPAQRATCLVHGDFRLGNVIVDRPGKVRALLDWELATLGDPLADVGYLLATWDEPGDGERFNAASPTRVPGFPSRDALLARYADGSGRDVSDVAFYVAFSFWRLGCILVGVLARNLQGATESIDPAQVEDLSGKIERCSEMAQRIVDQL